MLRAETSLLATDIEQQSKYTYVTKFVFSQNDNGKVYCNVR